MTAQWLFYGLALLSVLGAAGLILFRHPMNGAMSFVITLIALAGLYALLSAKLLFAIQLIVYAGAIMSLILFIIMFLNIQNEDLPEEQGRWLFLLAGGLLLMPVAGLLIKVADSLPPTATDIVGNGFGGVGQVGEVLFKDWLLPFEIVSILLLVSLVGAVILAKQRRSK
jgi:NADH-quinone oxidoreductase subunit J